MHIPFTARRGLWLGAILVLGLLVWTGVGFGLTILEYSYLSTDDQPAPPVVTKAAPEGLRTSSYYEAIARSGIFGGKPAKAAKRVSAELESVEDIKLRGVIMDKSYGRAVAVIEDSDGKQNLFRPGESIGNYEVVSIGKESVIVNRNGREYAVGLSLDVNKRKTRNNASKRVRNTKPVQAGGDFSKKIGQDRFVLDRQALSGRMNDLGSFMSTVRIKPFFKDGAPHGFQLAAMRPNSPAQQLGFKAGDVVTSVNGVSVNKPEDLIKLYRQVAQLETVTVELQRGGADKTITYTLK